MSDDKTGGGSVGPGTTFEGRFRIDAPIASGSYGSIFRGTDTKGATPVAIRVPGSRLLDATDVGVHWTESVKALAAIDHPNLVRTLAGGVEGKTAWAAVRFVGGGSLEDAAKSRTTKSTAADVATWLGKIAGALDALHGAGVIHRGVRPSAILFDADGRPLLADALLGRALGDAETSLLAGVAAAETACYLAPEASGAEPAGPASDQYSLAVVAYEALAGRLPFHGQAGAAASIVKNAKPAQPFDAATGVPTECAAAVMRALERAPAARFPSCAAFAKSFAAGAGVASATAPGARAGGSVGAETRFGAPASSGAAAPKSDPNATRIIPKAGARKGADVVVPVGGAPRKARSSIPLFAALGLLVAGGAAFFLMQEPEKPAAEVPVTIEITSPQEGVMVMSADVSIRGSFKSPRRNDVVKVEGVEVLATDGKFERLITLAQEGLQKIAITVENKGVVKKRVEWRVTYKAMWRPFTEEAKQLADAGKFVAAKEKLAVAKQKGAAEKDLPEDVVAAIARYEAPPSLAVTSPADGAKFDVPKVVVEGTFSSGRSTDKVFVDGAEVKVEEGRFKKELALKEGEREIPVSVMDGETARKATSIKVSYTRPPEAWEAWLSTWATADGKARDAATGYPSRVIRTKDGGAMVLVPAGEFWMGATKDAKTVLPGEKPGRKLTISKAYYMDEAPVSLGQWKKYVATGEGVLPNLPLKDPKDEMPIYNVTHLEATTFSTWVGGALPTEAQWERAAKGGVDDRVFPWGAEDDQKKRNGDSPSDGFEQWAPAKSFAPNEFGLYGMSGNVWQWCADWYDANYYVGSERIDPTGPAAGTTRVLRGGGWDSASFMLRVCYRRELDPRKTERTVGLRCVKALP